MKPWMLLLLCLSAVPGLAEAGKIYRWVDTEGNVHYGPQPTTDAQQIEEKKLYDKVERNNDTPYEVKKAQKDFPVTLYYTENCKDICDKSRKLLNDRGVPFSEKILKTQEDLDEFKKLSGINSSPTLGVGTKQFLAGYQEQTWHNALDVAGYPNKNKPKDKPKATAQDTPPEPAAAKNKPFGK